MSNSVIVNLSHMNFSKYLNMAHILNTCCRYNSHDALMGILFQNIATFFLEFIFNWQLAEMVLHNGALGVTKKLDEQHLESC